VSITLDPAAEGFRLRQVPDIFSRSVILARAAGVPTGFDQDLAAFSLAQMVEPAQVVDAIRRSGLSGKGGAAFPTYRKLEMMSQQRAAERCVVINGGEHEPGSDKDRYLLERYPETVLEGALILSRAACATSLIFAVKETCAEAIAHLRSLIDRIMPRLALPIDVRVVPIGEAYLVGEESALLEALENRPALPRGKPPFPIESGLNGFPTLVQNAETAAHIPFILAAGVEEYLSLGQDGLAVTLCTFGSEFKNSGVSLVPLGITLRELIFGFGGGLRSNKRVKAIQPGGPGSGFLSHQQLDVTFSDKALKEAGSAIGCCAIRAFSGDDDMVKVVAELMEFFAINSCGQCPSCRMETQMLSNIMRQTLAGKGNEKILTQVPAVIKNANAKPSRCGLVQMPAPAILSALKCFPEEFARSTSALTSV
jgi:NADH:ubiquinone oxidoreductase subunit F (NADH-binding)